LRRAGSPPDATFFVGDSLQQDIPGANRAGMQSVLIWSSADSEPSSGEDRPRHVIRRIPDLIDLMHRVES